MNTRRKRLRLRSWPDSFATGWFACLAAFSLFHWVDPGETEWWQVAMFFAALVIVLVGNYINTKPVNDERTPSTPKE